MIEKITTWDVKQETCILIGVITQKQDEAESKEYLEELEFLAYTAGAETQGVFTQKLERPDSSTFLGSGKIQEIKTFIDEHEIDLAIFDDELTPSQMKNSEKVLDIKILDRTNLILDIFSARARTSYARTG